MMLVKINIESTIMNVIPVVQDITKSKVEKIEFYENIQDMLDGRIPGKRTIILRDLN